MPRSHKGGRGQLRIIGGKWRGRKLQFVAADGLRPTGDRIRETLFNWLAPEIHGARCLDLFAGSGALGLEALSRGAQTCVFVDSSHQAVQQIESHLQVLEAVGQADCYTTTAQQYLQQATTSFDIAFVDPPFQSDFATQACRALSRPGLLAEGALIYLETAADGPQPQLPPHWQEYRDKVSGGVNYRLYTC